MQHTEGLKTGVLLTPLSDNTTLAEYLATEYVDLKPTFWVSANVAITFEIQHRNAANNATLWSHRFWLNATHPFDSPEPHDQFEMQEGERIRVQLIAGIVGSAQATILT